jgi:stage III sporulation protein SpoIIIAA
MLLADNLDQLLEIVPEFISKPLSTNSNRDQLVEIVLDVGRRPEARFANGASYLSYRNVSWQDLEYTLKRLGKFSGDNRAGIEKTLHRISALRNRQGVVIGLTCRIGRAVFGTVSLIYDILEKKKSILLLGRPGVGKTTAIREIARILSDDMKKRVIIIDTSNEIAGDGDLPHPSIGKARRMQVLNSQNQHQIMIEAVENHMPEIIIIDEIGTELEASAARTIAERGVQLVGTAHGVVLDNLIKNPTLADLIGGIQNVTLGDEEARRRGSSKSILERKAPPTFDVAIEIHDPKSWILHDDLERSVDLLLQGNHMPVQKREFFEAPQSKIHCNVNQFQKKLNILLRNDKRQKSSYINDYNRTDLNKQKQSEKLDIFFKKELGPQFLFLYVYGINTQDLRALIKMLKLPIILTRELQYADSILALGNLMKNNKKLRQVSNLRNLCIYTIQKNGLVQMSKALKKIVDRNLSLKNLGLPIVKKTETLKDVSSVLITPLEEVRLAIEEVVISDKRVIDLLPQPDSIRRLQYEVINHYHLKSMSVGEGSTRRIRIFP